MRSRRLLRVVERLGFNAAVGVVLFFSVLPLLWVFLTSIKHRLDIFALPPKLVFSPTFESYARLFSAGSGFIQNLSNSIIIAVGTTILGLIVSFLAAFAFSRMRFPGGTALLLVLLAARMLPPVTAVIPLFTLYNRWGLLDTHVGLVMIYAALNVPFATWMLKSFFDEIPKDLEDAAKVDGCTPLQAALRIILPLTAPGVAAVSIFTLILSWNEFMFAFIFTSTAAKTVPIRIAETIGELGIEWADMAAMGAIVILPTLVFTLLTQRYLIRGLTAGALK